MPSDFKFIHYEDLINPEYKQLVEGIYREQTIIQLQRATRKKGDLLRSHEVKKGLCSKTAHFRLQMTRQIASFF